MKVLLQRDHNKLTHTEIKFSSIHMQPYTSLSSCTPEMFPRHLLLLCFPFSLLSYIIVGRNTVKSISTSDTPEEAIIIMTK